MLSEQETHSSNHSKTVDPDVLINIVRIQTLDELADYYLQLKPDTGKDGFVNDYFRPMTAEASTSGREFLQEIMKIIDSGATVDLRFAPMAAACAYCVDVSKLLANGERELAWWSMSEARYWCGVTLASRGIDTARLATILATRKANAKEGGDKRAKKLKVVKEEAFRLAREMRPKTMGWRSRLHATDDIKERVVAFSKGPDRHELKETGAGKTIYDWLAEMPDADALFPKVGPAKNRGATTK